MLRFAWLSVLVVALDQLTKIWIQQTLAPYQVIEILPIFNLILTFNEGAAFSLLSEAGGWQRWFFIGLASVVSLMLLVWLTRLSATERRLAVGLALLLGGAVGNLIDRIVYGHVVDFLDFHWHGAHWPAFNVADSAITIGVGLLIFDTLTRRDEQ